MGTWEKYEKCVEQMGFEGLCDALAKAMGMDALESNLNYIIRCYEIDCGD